MKFKGWPPTATEFFVGLEAENTKAYWLEHKDVYERDVKAPMEALLAELRDEFGESRVFRPYRDTGARPGHSCGARFPCSELEVEGPGDAGK